MALLVVLKLITVTTSYASGNAGGIFGPALFIGAMLGGSVGLQHIIFSRTLQHLARMHWSGWVRHLLASCVLP
jgi:H+/Cl- antiporter ClcA